MPGRAQSAAWVSAARIAIAGGKTGFAGNMWMMGTVAVAIDRVVDQEVRARPIE